MSSASVAHQTPSPREISILDLANILLRNRRGILLCVFGFAVLPVLPTLVQRHQFSASMSFVPEVVDPSRSYFANLVGQFGIALPAVSQSTQTPQFYADLIQSREVLGAVADDSFPTDANGASLMRFPRMFGVRAETPLLERDQSIRVLRSAVVTSSVSKATGVITVTVTTPWPEASLSIAQRLIQAINAVSLRTRQTQAAAERRFSEERQRIALDSLRVAEDRLAGFLRGNRAMRDSPDLSVEQQRFQREVTMRQQMFTSLTQAAEEARMREVRDTPALSIIDEPILPSSPISSGRLRRAVVGALFGLLFGFLGALAADELNRRLSSGDPAARTFVGLMRDIRHGVLNSRGRNSPTRRDA
jgi:uncharacterized protein involved in exopolysaccharide biosynthesis